MADYEAYKPTLNDEDYANKLNDFMDAVEADMNAKLNTVDFVSKSIVSTSINYTVLADDYTIEIDATVADVTITLPTASTNVGRILVFRRKDATTYIVAIGTVCNLEIQNEFVVLQSNGTAWVRIG